MPSIVVPVGGATPGTPTGVSAAGGNAQATVVFSIPSYTGKSSGTVTYRATSTPGGIEATSSSSPIVVGGLSNGISYTFKVETETDYGVDSPQSTASNAVTPEAPAPPPPPANPCASPPFPQNCTYIGITCSGTTSYEYYDCGQNQTCPGTGGYNGALRVGLCGYSPCPGAGQLIASFCSGTTRVNQYTDGNCGVSQTTSPNSFDCGYVPPAPCQCLAGSAGIKSCQVELAGCLCYGSQQYALTYSSPAGCQPCGTEVILGDCEIIRCSSRSPWDPCLL